LIEAGQPERRHVGTEEFHWMGIERRDDHRPSFVKSARDGTADHRLVAKVESIKIAECDNAPLQMIGDAAGEGKPLHSRGLYRANQWVGR